VIADLLFLILPLDVFSQPQKYSSPELVVWLLTYTFAIYNDFAGYTSIVRGISGLFGIPLSVNFNAPYFARTFTELWQRWHITLSDWLRDYIFTPTTRFLLKKQYSRTHVFSIVLPPMITMFISALWHGVGWNMFVWGGLHGLYLVIERISTLGKPAKPANMLPYWRVIVVFSLTSLAWVPFRTELPAALNYWRGLFSPNDWLSALHSLGSIHQRLPNILLIDVTALVFFSIGLDLAHYRLGEQGVRRLPVPIQALAVNIGLFALLIAFLAQNVPAPFVYQGF